MVYVLSKQQAVTEFLVAESESVMNIHQQLKNVYDISVVEKSAVSHRTSQADCSETGQVKLTDACFSGRPTTVIYRVSQEEWTKLRESVPYVELYRYNPKHLYPSI